MPRYPENLNLSDAILLANKINTRFNNYGQAYESEVLQEIRAFPRPILVDFNNILVNNIYPIQVNPSALDFLTKLKTVGNIFIVTVAEDRYFIRQILVENELWSPDTVLLTADNYDFMLDLDERLVNRYPHSTKTEGWKMVNQYVTMVKELGIDIQLDQFSHQDVRSKRLAPLFHKPFLIPLIDDSPDATKNNPGILGLTVAPFEPAHAQTDNRESLMKATDRVLEHYGSGDFA